MQAACRGFTIACFLMSTLPSFSLSLFTVVSKNGWDQSICIALQLKLTKKTLFSLGLFYGVDNAILS